MERRISVYEAKAKLSELIRAAQSTSDIVITHNGTPVVRMIPYSPTTTETLEERLERLSREGRVTEATQEFSQLIQNQDHKKLSSKKLDNDIVKRFLEERE